MSLYRDIGVRTLINAKGTATRLSGAPLRPEVAEAMVEASRHCVDMAELQAAAWREIAAVTGAEAGYVASGAAACLLLAAAACLARLDPARMARLPDTDGRADEIIMVRSQRNFYDHAIRASGASIIEVGLPDRYAGAGVRDAAIWEIEAAISPNTAAIFYVADAAAQPPLPEITSIAAQHGVPVIVDAAAQLPPQDNLKRFIREGADLVAFSGGKALGGPQASGFLCGKRELIMSAALQHLDLDVYEDMWDPPASLIDRSLLKGMPPHGIGRTCKVGKEEVMGLLTALRLFVAEGDARRHAIWLRRLQLVRKSVADDAKVIAQFENADAVDTVPLLVIRPQRPDVNIRGVIAKLMAGEPSVHVDPARRASNSLVINPVALNDSDIPALGAALREAFDA